MILADKILSLRKHNGWSQEELAEKMNVSRQSVSKWESAAAIPDINKILELAKLFGVTTDYLLKDDMEKTEYSDTDEADSRIHVSLQEMKDFLKSKAAAARQIAFGVMLCILSPVLLILFSGMATAGNMSENIAYATGIVVLLLMIAGAVAIFIISGEKMKRFKHLQNGNVELEYGVSGIIKEKRAAFDKKYLLSIVIGVILCILCAVPLIIAGIIGAADMTYIALTALLLVIVSVAAYLFVTSGTLKSGYDQLLLEGDYEPAKIEKNKKESKLAGIYWPIILAIYLGWSFITNNWGITWVVWPIAVFIFAAISAALRASNNED